MLLLNDDLRLEGKGLGVAGTYLAAVWELREVGTRNCCLSSSASVPCCHNQEMPAVPWGAFELSVASIWARASPGACSEQSLSRVCASAARAPQCPSLGHAWHRQDTAGTAPPLQGPKKRGVGCLSGTPGLLLPHIASQLGHTETPGNIAGREQETRSPCAALETQKEPQLQQLPSFWPDNAHLQEKSYGLESQQAVPPVLQPPSFLGGAAGGSSTAVQTRGRGRQALLPAERALHTRGIRGSQGWHGVPGVPGASSHNSASAGRDSAAVLPRPVPSRAPAPWGRRRIAPGVPRPLRPEQERLGVVPAAHSDPVTTPSRCRDPHPAGPGRSGTAGNPWQIPIKPRTGPGSYLSTSDSTREQEQPPVVSAAWQENNSRRERERSGSAALIGGGPGGGACTCARGHRAHARGGACTGARAIERMRGAGRAQVRGP